ncbi:MAG TPA: phosphoenolpyruvate--protein phosphotransferase [Gemmatimonadales bacterium]|jgi:phosphotransferase system enzyme I (PtsI)
MVKERLLRGVGVSPGIAIGPARFVHWELPRVTRRLVASDRVDAEVARLHEAVDEVRSLLDQLRVHTQERAGAEEAKIFDAQILMLEDPEFLREVEALIHDNQLSAERAFEFKTLEMRALWAQSSSPRLRQRVADLAGVQLRVLNRLLGKSFEHVLQSEGDQPVIVFMRELTPGLMIQFERDRVAGFATEQGTRTAHAAILARSLGIPCVMGLVGAMNRIESGVQVVLDGSHGAVLVAPTPAELDAARETERVRLDIEQRLEADRGAPNVTLDGDAVDIRATVDLPDDIDLALRHGAAGIGLLRTEFLLMGRTGMPSEEEQVAVFERAARAFADFPVVIRSYDLGGDKYPAMFSPEPEPNPFLGWRAIRVSLDEPQFFRIQLRALLRARRHGDIRVMLPLVTAVEELERVKEILAEEREALAEAGVAAAESMPLGVMIETPAAALLVEQISARCDFLSVGTSDLTQYTLAVDRGNARMAERFDPLHPAVVRLLHEIVTAGQRHGIEASVCGLMASDPVSVFLLIGLGYRVFSVATAALPVVGWVVRQLHGTECAECATQVLTASTGREVREHLLKALASRVDLKMLDGGELPGLSLSASL